MNDNGRPQTRTEWIPHAPLSALLWPTCTSRPVRPVRRPLLHSDVLRPSGDARCPVCGQRELAGELRHSYVHARDKLAVEPASLTYLPRGPFYSRYHYRPSVGARRTKARHRRRPSRLAAAGRIGSGLLGMAMVGGAAYGVTNWVVGLNGSSSGEGQAATVSNLSISAVSSPTASNLLYPGSTGDVVLTITNPNVFAVTITGVDLPTSTTYATGYSSANLTGAISGCSASTSDVNWSFATATSGSVHSFVSALTVGAGSNLTVTMTNDANMTTSAPAACEGAYFSMPSLTGVVATGGAGTATTSPATDAWVS